MKKTLGGDRLGAGKRMQVNMHEYGRSTHDLGHTWRSTMSAGTLVPFLKKLALPGDTFDINLQCDVKTHPTLGPLFGSFKVQLDLFLAPIRLYQAQLHNNELGIGLAMQNVKLPLIELEAPSLVGSGITTSTRDIDNWQINPSCILNYLGIRGIGLPQATAPEPGIRRFNAIPLLSYWDIYKNYYANKQEPNGQVIHSLLLNIDNNVASVKINYSISGNVVTMPTPPVTPGNALTPLNTNDLIEIDLTAITADLGWMTMLKFEREDGTIIDATQIGQLVSGDVSGTNFIILYDVNQWGATKWKGYRWQITGDTEHGEPFVQQFPLSNIDDMRTVLLTGTAGTAVEIMGTGIIPYIWLRQEIAGSDYISRAMMCSQEGLAIKTYNSDLFNNWLNKEWIDGVNGINEITAVSTATGEFKIDALILARKVYDMLNRIAISDGTYQAWVDTVYTKKRFAGATSPMYMGGLIKELVFEEVVSSNSDGTNNLGQGGTSGQPLGTLAGKGRMGHQHKGGRATIHVDEPSYIMGIVSITPRIDYSQGNDDDINLQTMDDLHKPALDEIGFQDLITEQMAWWDTWQQPDGTWQQKSAGKQPAWINYMTETNKVKGNFAIQTNEQFMVLARRYKPLYDTFTGFVGILDLTTYINPSIYNNIFAQTSLDAQNFWVQIGIDIESRRLISARLIPNL